MPYQGFSIIDFHIHFPLGWNMGRAAKRDPQADYARQRRARWRLEWDFPEPEEIPSPEEVADRWAGEVDRHGLDRVVVVTGGDNDILARLVSRHPGKLLGMAHHSLERPDAAAELARALGELGLRGYKVIGTGLGVSLDDPALQPVWRLLEERSAPLLIHFGFLGLGGGHTANQDPLTIAGVARRHPGLPIIIPHFGSGYWEELLRLCWACPNVMVDTSGSNQWVRWLPYRLDLEDLFRKAYETIGPRRLLFGTDSSWFPRGFVFRYLQEQMRACRLIGMPDQAIQDIFGGNAARLLDLPWPPQGGECSAAPARGG
ncbi:MAG: amidohydrolase family protein [bacterium]|nr:amidohydrolase family protein [bacterium]